MWGTGSLSESLKRVTSSTCRRSKRRGGTRRRVCGRGVSPCQRRCWLAGEATKAAQMEMLRVGFGMISDGPKGGRRGDEIGLPDLHES